MAAPLLIVAVGNPSRGDDALGPALVERLRAAGVDADGTVELLVDFQLQVEHALDLVGRRAVLFVDAARPGTIDGVVLQPVTADDAAPLWSHALRPQSVLAVYAQLQRQPPPPAWLLAIEGRDFALGEGLGEAARRRLDVAEAKVQDWLRERAGARVPRRVT